MRRLAARVLEVLPGLALAVGVMLVAGEAAQWLGAGVLRLQGLDPAGRASPVSGISMSIVLGLLIANTVGTGGWKGRDSSAKTPRNDRLEEASADAEGRTLLRTGLAFAVRTMLRLGIIFVGIRLSIFDVLRLGAWGVPVVLVIIVAALLLTHAFSRAIGVSDNMGTLAAASTAICGVTAALSVGPAIEAEEREVAYTVANVTLFGLVAMLTYPYLAHALFGSSSGSIGLFLGTGIHDTSQVLGAALSYKEMFRDEAALQVATVTKLTRNVFLVAVVPALAYLHVRRTGHAGARVSVARLFPVFVLGFLGMAILRSLGDAGLAAGGRALGVWERGAWLGIAKTIGEGWGSAALGTAMAGVGLSTNLRAFRSLGPRPLYVGALSAAVVGALALLLAALVGPRL